MVCQQNLPNFLYGMESIPLSPGQTFRFKLGNPPPRLVKPTPADVKISERLSRREEYFKELPKSPRDSPSCSRRTEDLASDWHSDNGAETPGFQ
jgi:hypothetical protein